ncbi:BQ2448_437 [Microbotryum intermedium]|uniref:cAMP-dependent protein kinase n=1 Tax=Microbotryum intermedium TaxID=269621 RepID=A0A238FB58_9BASI|nr:BQ2448_437 [Microbotryum intermedium]
MSTDQCTDSSKQVQHPLTPPHSARSYASRPMQAQQQQAYQTHGHSSYTKSTSSSREMRDDRTTGSNQSGTTAQTSYHERDVQGKLENLGLHGGHHVSDQMSLDSLDMHDGTPTGRPASAATNNTVHGGHSSAGHAGARPTTTAGAASSSSSHMRQAPLTGGGVPPSRGVSTYSNANVSTTQRQTTAGQRPVSTNLSVMSPTPSDTSSTSRKTSSRYNLSDFSFNRTLGTGSFGRVHLVRSQHNSRSYAIKVLNKERVVKMKQVEHTNSEREMLERVRHPFLVNLWGTFKDSKNLYMVMDFVAGGELFSLLRKSQRFPDPVAKFFAAEVALALDYLHSLDIIYRDLKPENILLGADGHVKITDFGFAKHVPDITWTLCGTPDYLAPEIVQSRGYNKSVDWYALGVLMFEMLAGYPPFFTEDSNPMRLYEKIIAGKVRYPGYFAPEAKDLLKSLLTPDITKRFGNLANGSRDIFSHVWFQEVDWERLYRKEIPAPYVPKVEGDWDSSNFDAYPEVDMSDYGSTGPDPHGHLFTLF